MDMRYYRCSKKKINTQHIQKEDIDFDKLHEYMKVIDVNPHNNW